MKVLVAISDARERRRIVAFLAAANHDVAEAATSATAAGLLEGEGDLEIAFVDVGLVGRARMAPKRIYVIAIVPALAASSDYWTAYTAGADDVMRVTAPKDEICGRAGALARIRCWAAPARSVAERLAALTMWSQMEHIVAAEIGELIGEVLVPVPETDVPIIHAGLIPLTLSAEHIQIRIGLGISAPTTMALQHSLLAGDTSNEAITDAMREMANTAAGAIKRAALDSGAEFTIGLPSNTNILTAQPQADRRAWALRAASGVTFSCVAVAISNAPKLVAARDLREGMVLSRDVRNQIGVLIAPAGTNITRTTVEQLARLLGTTATLEVNDIAA